MLQQHATQYSHHLYILLYLYKLTLSILILLYLYNLHANKSIASWTCLSFYTSTTCMSIIQPSPLEPLCLALLVQTACQSNLHLLNLSALLYLHMHFNATFASWTSLSCSTCTRFISIQPLTLEPLCLALLVQNSCQCNLRLLNCSGILCMSMQPSSLEPLWLALLIQYTYKSNFCLFNNSVLLYLYKINDITSIIS